MLMNSDPRSEYSQRLKLRQASAARCDSIHHRLGNTRLAVFIAAAVMAYCALRWQLFSAWWLATPVCGFVALMSWHSHVLRNLQRFKRAIEFYERGFARLDEHWEGAGEQGDRFVDPAHPYAQDLDLFGKGSLFQLLCSARTRAGERILASWLKKPASLEEIRSRQGAVEELRPNLALREDLAVLGTDIGAVVDPDALIKWGNGAALLKSLPLRILAALIALLTLASLIIWLSTGQHLWFLLIVLIELIFQVNLKMDQIDQPHLIPFPSMLSMTFSHLKSVCRHLSNYSCNSNPSF